MIPFKSTHLCQGQDVAQAGVPSVEVSQLAPLAAQPQLQCEQQPCHSIAQRSLQEGRVTQVAHIRLVCYKRVVRQCSLRMHTAQNQQLQHMMSQRCM